MVCSSHHFHRKSKDGMHITESHVIGKSFLPVILKNNSIAYIYVE